jgi:hypothetical protein
MLQTLDSTTLKLIVGVVYINPYASPEALKRIRRFVKRHARGHYRWGNLYRYPMIEFEDVDDLTVVRKKFARLIDGYKDLSECPEQPD